MGRLTPLQIRNLKDPGRYNDGDGLFLELTGPNKGNWQLRATVMVGGEISGWVRWRWSR